MNLRKLARDVKKFNATPLRRGPAKASDGTEKGPTSVPSREDLLRRRRHLIVAAAERMAAEKTPLTTEEEV